MIKLLTTKQIKKLDAYTIKNEPISSINLIERAAKVFVDVFINIIKNKNQSIAIYSGTGNNGADGLAIGRLLFEKNYCNLNIKIACFSNKVSLNFTKNLERLYSLPITIRTLEADKTFPKENASILIDALLGSGLNRPLSGAYSALVTHLNTLNKTIFAIDVPTGFFAEGIIPVNSVILKVYKVITFQRIPINFLLPESSRFIGNWKSVSIGLSNTYIQSLYSSYFFVEKKDISNLLLRRTSFQNKWDFGHALIFAGNLYTMGAAFLCADSCLHTGSGNTSACIPAEGLTALNSFSPEIMFIPRPNKKYLDIINWNKFTAIAIGPGLGCDSISLKLFKWLLKNYNKPIVIDADALNILAKNKYLWQFIPKNSLLTPHVKEFDRLFGYHDSWWKRLCTMQLVSKQKKVIILLKNRYSIICTPDEKTFFDSTGNAAMSVGGMGDILTGIIVSLLAQGYSPDKAAIIGAYIHGKSGDDLVKINKFQTIIPRKMIAQIPKTWSTLV